MLAKLALQRTNIVAISDRLQPSKRFRTLKRDGVPLLVTSRRCSAFVEANIVLSTQMAHFLGQSRSAEIVKNGPIVVCPVFWARIKATASAELYVRWNVPVTWTTWQEGLYCQVVWSTVMRRCARVELFRMNIGWTCGLS